MKNNFNFISIGDITTDAFIQLKDANVEQDKNGALKLSMRFGDKIPYNEVYVIPAVGNSANAAVSASRLGLKSAIVTNLGDDYHGQECLKALKAAKVSTEFIKIHKGQKSNYHYVLLFKGERTILIKHHDYPYSLPNINSPKWVYLSSMGEHSLSFHGVLEKYFVEHPEIKLAFQPGTYQMKFGTEALKGIYKRTNLFLCNKEESQRILKTEEKDIKKLLQGIFDLGPKMVVITDGVKGAYVYDGKETWFMPMYPDPKPPIDRTGAGDAFSSTFAVALALGMSIPDALMWGPVNSMSVVQQIGAQAGLLTKKEIEEYLKKAPVDYKPKLLD